MNSRAQFLTAIVLLIGALSLAFTVSSQAAVIDFEDLGSSQDCCGPIPDAYNGFDWNSGETETGTIGRDHAPGSGYQVGTSGNVSAFNWNGVSGSVIKSADGSLFDFNGAYFTSAWEDQSISFEGWNAGMLTFSSDEFAISTQSPSWIGLDWAAIDTLVINNTKSHWIMDNFTYNELPGYVSVAEFATVPEPGSIVLVMTGLAGIGAARRRRLELAD